MIVGSSLTNKVLQFSEGSDGYLNISVPGHHPFLSAAVSCEMSFTTDFLFCRVLIQLLSWTSDRHSTPPVSGTRILRSHLSLLTLTTL